MATRAHRFSLVIFSFLLATSSRTQTIHKDDLPYFVGKYPVSIVSSEKGKTDKIIDCSQFLEWMIVRPDNKKTKRRSSLENIKSFRDGHWVYSWPDPDRIKRVSGSTEMASRKLLNLRFYMLMDCCGHRFPGNVLSVWEPVSVDSLRYFCGQRGPFNISGARISLVTVFPDSSLLTVVETGGGDAEEAWGGHLFLRGESPCSFQLFYQTAWSENEFSSKNEYAFYDLKHLHPPSYKVVEVTEHLTFARSPDYHLHIDSATAKIIDLWELAKEHFHIQE